MWQEKFRNVLENNFDSMKAKNRAFSLRSLAKKLGISPGALSEIMRGNRKVSVKKAKEIILRLPKTDQSLLNYLDHLELNKKNRILLPEEAHEVISHWYNFALLALLECENTSRRQEDLAARLGLAPAEIAEILKKLISLGLIKDNKDGSYQATGIQWQTTDGLRSASIRASHRDGLVIAEKALDQVPIELRDFISLKRSKNISA